LRTNKDQFIKHLNKNKIFPQFHYKPLFMFSFFNKKKSTNFTGAKSYFRNTLSIPLYYNIKKNEQEYILEKMQEFINHFKIKQ
jgi:dTDP-4-amino-4,6-dideoxygalactose transaminase